MQKIPDVGASPSNDILRQLLLADALRVVFWPFTSLLVVENSVLAEVSDETPDDAVPLEIEPSDEVPFVEIEDDVIVPFSEIVVDELLEVSVFAAPNDVLPLEIEPSVDVPLVEIDEVVEVPLTVTDVTDESVEVFEEPPSEVLPVDVELVVVVPLVEVVLMVLFMVLFVVESIALTEKLFDNGDSVKERITNMQNVKYTFFISVKHYF